MSHLRGGKPRILFMYFGVRRKSLLPKLKEGLSPDSQFRGYLQMKERDDMDVDFVDVFDEELVPPWVLRHFPFQFVPLYHLPRVLSYDYVISSEALLLSFVLAGVNKFRTAKTKFIFVAINVAVMLRRHGPNTFGRIFLRLAWRSTFHIAYLAELQRSFLLESGIPPARLSYMPLGIDIDFFADARGAGPGDYVLSVGKDLGRDFKTLFEAAARLPYQFIIATGRKNIPKGVDIPPNVSIRYNIDIQGVKELYRHARITCVTLKGEDTVEGCDCTGQTVMLEAFGAFQPVVASDRLWIRDYFTADEDYIPVPTADVESLAAAIKRVWEDDTLRDALGQAGNRAAQRKYRTQGMADVLIRVIQEDRATHA